VTCILCYLLTKITEIFDQELTSAVVDTEILRISAFDLDAIRSSMPDVLTKLLIRFVSKNIAGHSAVKAIVEAVSSMPLNSPDPYKTRSGYIETLCTATLLRSGIELDRLLRTQELLHNDTQTHRSLNQNLMVAAACCGVFPLVADLIKKGVKDTLTCFGSALEAAATRNDLETARLILESCDLPEAIIARAVEQCASTGHIQILEILHEPKYALHISARVCANALALAAKNGHQNIIEFILHHDPLVEIDRLQLTWASRLGTCDVQSFILYHAGQNGQTNIARHALDNGANPYVKVTSGPHNLLRTAVTGGHFELTRILLERRYPVHRTESYWASTKYYTPLQAAAQRGRVKLAQLLIGHGASISNDFYDGHNKKSHNQHPAYTYGHCPLYLATRDGHVEMVKLLLLNGAEYPSHKETKLWLKDAVEDREVTKVVERWQAARMGLSHCTVC
jgi:Ankyrin repeats (3 copies)